MHEPRSTWRRLLAATILLAAPGRAHQPPAPTPDVLVPTTAGGIEVVDQALAKLSSHRRLMVVGAHPDDEDNALLTWVGRGLAGEAAYFSLSRGEGGQNLIGTELGVELGIVRTGELEAARRIEGTRQYFARAYDFGYTRSLDETLERWPREILLTDTMRAIRRFKPQVIVAVFPADARAGHGQHQASGLMAREAFAAAREGRDFPELDAEGLGPWVPSALYQRAWSREQMTGGFDLGVLDPVSGRTLGQVAADSRSRHRSQDMGRLQRFGCLEGGAVWEAGVGEGGNDVFAGIDTRLEAIAGLLDAGDSRESVAAALRRVAELAGSARSELTPAGLGKAVTPLVELIGELDRALESVGAGESPRRAPVSELLAEKRQIAGRALMAAAGVMVDATVDRERVVPGEGLTLSAELWSAGDSKVQPRGVYLLRPHSKELLPLEAQGVSERTGIFTWSLAYRLPATQSPTVPYYLRRPLLGDLYDWREVPASERGAPRELPPLGVWFLLEIEGVSVSFPREAVYRYGDQASGEVRRPLRVVPALEVEVERGPMLLNRAMSSGLTLEAVVRSNVDHPVGGRLTLELPWESAMREEALRFDLDPSRRESVEELSFEIPPSVARGLYEVTVSTTAADPAGSAAPASEAPDAIAGKDAESGGALTLPVLEYPHIRATPLPRPARVSLSVFDLELPAVEKVGYVVGASDRVPGVLSALGLPVEILTAEQLARGDLAAYDAIVIGSRAYEIDPALAAANERLLDFARGGGTLIVQYQQYQFVRGQYAPFPLTIARPHGRVTDETVAIEVLDGRHPIFRRPNQIGEEDWRDWVQERGLYFADSWDDSYLPLLSLADPGREAERGALLVAPVGEGFYVYTGLSFFRQLPAGVPGAIRLFANLLELGSGS